MVLVNKNGLIFLCMRVNGSMIKPMDMDDWSIPMEIHILANGKMIKLMEKDNIDIRMAQSMLVNGLKICSMDLVNKIGRMGQLFKGKKIN